MINFKVTITPKFDIKEIIDSTIKKDWINYKSGVKLMSLSILSYMKNYINKKRKRAGGTGNLSNSFVGDFEETEYTVSFGLGKISALNANAPYWKVVNFGGYSPYNGKGILGYFGGGNPPDRSQKGHGKEQWTNNFGEGTKFLMYPGIIRPMHYIRAGNNYLKRKSKNLLNSFKSGKKA